MHREQKPIKYIAVIMLLVFLLSACDTEKIRIGEVRMMYGTNQDGLISFDVSTFTGIEKGSFDAERGQTIAFDFDVEVNKGSLTINCQDPMGNSIWREELVEGARGRQDIPVDLPGEYIILIQGKGFGGSFDVTWETK